MNWLDLFALTPLAWTYNPLIAGWKITDLEAEGRAAEASLYAPETASQERKDGQA